ncbi:hypothetical protein TNIN_410271 [Trichonephila inaurata madagascariensis]|uniref:Uncharacterized protein n=1 Tax=Trichonephila inaurata madagascariensis TaxID=2747483 RepID=A0A8X6MI87_9ARAC|nr:hypothetical protein TNIN_410271 [Trichonephila inaurata madagascariensis]
MKPSDTTTRGNKTVFVSKQLSNCSHVFIHNNATSSSLQPVYSGPYAGRHRAPKYFDVEIKRISTDRLKPYFALTKTEASERTTENILSPEVMNSLPHIENLQRDCHLQVANT